ncbi:Alpha/Beta hydrolase protein [Phyllosticta citriasiana]|uniref:Alpha/Beta hydrolase protein n=1 Tax=Phyllosticta citriasiana TaxID=595635 RepID=A0ABR1KVQ5_9PEZI
MRALTQALAFVAAWLPAVAAASDKTAADYFIHSLPGAPPGPLLKMHAGHVEVDAEHHGNLFFWHYQNRHIANRQRTVIWLNGGPGCSSMDGAMMEIGPYRVTKDQNLVYNNGSWDEFANLLFVDNPVGTGFSYVDTNAYLHELNEMADQFVIFLEKWFTLFPEYMYDDIYIAGESYAGQHIPYITKAIMERNKKAQSPWKLQGLLIGNGWISPVDQYLSYLPFAYKNGLIRDGTEKAKRLEAAQALCIKSLDAGSSTNVDVQDCEDILSTLLIVTTDTSKPEMEQCINMYDIRLRDDESCGMNWPPDLAQLTPYLRRDDVKAALHIDAAKRTGWQECSGSVSTNFKARNSKASIEILPDILEEIPILLFSGEKDLICNHIGTEELINNMKWNGGKGFDLGQGEVAPRRDWTFEGDPAGIYQEARNLTYVMFYNSSHMVPFDYPRRTRDMLDRFMGVDLSSIGGKPVDSSIDGEKGPLTSVGSHPNSTEAEEEQGKMLEDATWQAYYKSGEVALIIVASLAILGGFFVWRDRRRRAGYQSVFPWAKDNGSSILRGGMGLEGFRSRSNTERDMEAAYEEHELVGSMDDSDDAEPGRGKQRMRNGDAEREPFSLVDSDDESDRGTGLGYRGIANPFEEEKPRISEWTAQEIATLQSRLDKQLGPEYISSRKGPAGRTLYYLPAEKAINLANEVFGFNGWSSSIRDVQIDFVDQSQSSGKISLGLSVIIRVTLKDGTFHEDIGYGHIENAQGKAAAFEKAKKEAATDALKRALRTFGNVLGNCLYDKSYENKISKMKVAPSKWNPDRLHRHPDYAPVKQENVKTELQPAADYNPPSCEKSMLSKSMDGEDEFGGNLFEGVDFDRADAAANDDSAYESMLAEPAQPKPETPAQLAQHSQLARVQSMPSMRPPNLPSGALKQQQPQQYRPQVNSKPAPPAQQNVNAAQRPDFPNRAPTPNGQLQQQLSRPTAQQLQAAAAAAMQNRKSGSTPPMPLETPNLANGQPAPRFISGRAAELLQKAEAGRAPPPNAPDFNPHLESPSLRRTSGFNHNTSQPISRLSITGIANGSTTNGDTNGQGQPPAAGGGGVGRPNFNMNPQADMTRRIGMPAAASSPLANRTSYKPPLKRLAEQQPARPPLADMSNVPADGHGLAADGLDVKRTRLSGDEAQ